MWRTSEKTLTVVRSTCAIKASEIGSEATKSLVDLQNIHNMLTSADKSCADLRKLENHPDKAVRRFFDLTCDIILMVEFWARGNWVASEEWTAELVETHPNIRCCVDEWNTHARYHPTVSDSLVPQIESFERVLQALRAGIERERQDRNDGVAGEENDVCTLRGHVVMALLTNKEPLICGGDRSWMLFKQVFEWCDRVKAAYSVLSDQDTADLC